MLKRREKSPFLTLAKQTQSKFLYQWQSFYSWLNKKCRHHAGTFLIIIIGLFEQLTKEDFDMINQPSKET